MSLPDFTKPEILAKFNEYLADKSYVDGTEASQADLAVYEAIKAPVDDAYPNVSRWHSHIASFEGKELPGDKSKAASLLNFGGAADAAEGDDDEVDLFGSDDEEDAEAERIKAERVAMYKEKKAAKGPAPPSKSVITFDVKPWDDETDMKALEEGVRAIEMEGLLWGASKLVPIGYGVNKLQITIVVEDDKVSMDDLQERVQELEDYVQSSDIAAMQKL
ncbi:Translation elongation factor 1 beta [Malassezia cuniculi]|uniref:Translation elongation factor 1 beta n=1 Tax=Malassezia cuniculi TaxID=948313 RepID=A0AAF0J886_9BASI|nr:Translation elongation factor 1 beta [Malassezia cuniculi]